MSGPQQGVMVCLRPPASLARTLALPGGEPAEELHVTLAYLGKIPDLDPAALRYLPEALGAWAARHDPLDGVLSGVGRFSIPSKDAFYVSADLPGANRLYLSLCSTLDAVGVPPSRAHGFTPHMTLAYLDAEEPNPLTRLAPSWPVRFGDVQLWQGGRRTRYPLLGLP